MTDKQPDALRLAEQLSKEIVRTVHLDLMHHQAAAELRRLHEVNAELVETLAEIAEWTERYTTPGHPISTVARAALAKVTGEEQ